MPLSALETHVHPDWQILAQEQAIWRQERWRAVEIVVAVAALGGLTAGILFPGWTWSRVLPLLLFSVVFWMAPVWTLLRAHMTVAASLLPALLVATALLGALMAAVLSAPVGLLDENAGGQPGGLLILAVLMPLITWPMLARLRRRFPTQMVSLGFRLTGWPLNLAVGVVAGAAMGFHLLLAYGLANQPLQPAEFGVAAVVWTVLFQAGIYALGEEMLFRGLAYQLLMGGSQSDLSLGPALRIVSLNVLVYLGLWPTFGLTGAASILWFLVYAAVLAVMTTYLRYRQQSLLPGIACRVAFFVSAVLVFAS